MAVASAAVGTHWAWSSARTPQPLAVQRRAPGPAALPWPGSSLRRVHRQLDDEPGSFRRPCLSGHHRCGTAGLELRPPVQTEELTMIMTIFERPDAGPGGCQQDRRLPPRGCVTKGAADPAVATRHVPVSVVVRHPCAPIRSRQACSQRRQDSAQTRQWSCISAWLAHSSPQALQAATHASRSTRVRSAS